MGLANQLGSSIKHEYPNDYEAKTSKDRPEVFVEKKRYPIDDYLQSDGGEKYSKHGAQMRLAPRYFIRR